MPRPCSSLMKNLKKGFSLNLLSYSMSGNDDCEEAKGYIAVFGWNGT